MLTQLRTRVLLLVAAAAMGTLIVALVPGLQFAYRRPAAHVGRFRRDRRLDERSAHGWR